MNLKKNLSKKKTIKSHFQEGKNFRVRKNVQEKSISDRQLWPFSSQRCLVLFLSEGKTIYLLYFPPLSYQNTLSHKYIFFKANHICFKQATKLTEDIFLSDKIFNTLQRCQLCWAIYFAFFSLLFFFVGKCITKFVSLNNLT